MLIFVNRAVRGFLKNWGSRYGHERSSEFSETDREALISSASQLV